MIDRKTWSLGESVVYEYKNDVILGKITGFPKVHNAALARVKFDKFKREKVVPLDLLSKME